MNCIKNGKNVINLKKFIFKTKNKLKLISQKNLINISFNTESKNDLFKTKKSLQTQTNNFQLFNKNNIYSPKLKRNKTINYFYKNQGKIKKSFLSEKDKLKLKSIVKIFNKNKLATKDLFNKEKKIPLNSVNKSNFYFLFNEDEKNSKTKKMKKSASILLSCSMMNKFNNKTSTILDIPFSKNKFNKNIFSFRRQILSSYTNQDRNMENLDTSKNKYQNALDIFEETEDKKMNKIQKDEEQFYKLKKNLIGLYEIVLDKENENNESIKRFHSFKNSKSQDYYYGKNKKDFNYKKNNPLISKNGAFNIEFNSSKKILKSLLNKTNLVLNNKNIKNENTKIDKSLNKEKENSLEYKNNKKKIRIIFNTNNENEKSSEKNNKNKKYKDKKKSLSEIQKKRKSNIKLNNKKIKKVKFKDEKEIKMLKFMKKFRRFQKMRIMEKSKRLANSISQMNFFHYKPKGYADYKNSTLNINSENLKRIIKLMRINKYLCDVEDDDLLVMHSKKLRNLMKEAEIKYYLCNKKDFQLSYLRKNLKPQTISKFCEIKNSFFGLPC